MRNQIDRTFHATSLIALIPNLRDSTGHQLIYHKVIQEEMTKINGNFNVLVPFKSRVPPNWLPFFRDASFSHYNLGAHICRFIEFCRLFISKDKNRRVFFLESFNTPNYAWLVLAALLFIKKKDSIALLFRYPLTLLPLRGKLHLFMTRLLAKKCEKRCFLMTDSELIANSFQKQFKLPLMIMPIPHGYRPLNGQKKKLENLILWWPGDPQQTKGLSVIQRLLSYATRAHIELWIATNTKLLTKPGLSVKFLDNPLSEQQYEECLARVDCVLLPYCSTRYREATSGIFVETIIAGKMPLVSEETWCAYELRKFDLSELILDWQMSHLFEHIQALTKSDGVVQKLEEMRNVYTDFHRPECFIKKLNELASILNP